MIQNSCPTVGEKDKTEVLEILVKNSIKLPDLFSYEQLNSIYNNADLLVEKKIDYVLNMINDPCFEKELLPTIRGGSTFYDKFETVLILGLLILYVKQGNSVEAFSPVNIKQWLSNDLSGRVNSKPNYMKPSKSSRFDRDIRFYNQNEEQNFNERTEKFVKTFKIFDGTQAKLSDRSESHLISRHGHNIGINDTIPNLDIQNSPYPNLKSRTRVNKENKKLFRTGVDNILTTPENIETFHDVSIRGIKSRVYLYTPTDSNAPKLVFGVHEEKKFKGEMKRFQPISPRQETILRDQNRLD